MKINDIIKERRKKIGLSADKIAEQLGISRASYYRYETDEVYNLPIDIIKPLSNILHISPMLLMGWEDEHGRELEEVPLPNDTVRIPVLGEVVAGQPMYVEQNIIGYENISEELARRGEFFALHICGDSMSPEIRDGDTVIIRRTPYVDSGKVAIVCINGDTATCKKFYMKDNGILLKAYNPDVFPDKFFTSKEVMELPITIIGEVVEVRKRTLP